MSNRIDQRIVEMSFENAKFEKGILQSKASLQEFSKVLGQTGTGKDFSGLETSLQTVTKSFSALEQIGIGALRRIGEAAINAGTSLFRSLAIDPITKGFGEMELKMNSTQTIMASTGESLEVVNQRLQELNEYSDKTIYSFSDMTENIGKFTNAGVKLEDAVASIKGISNAAALSGANANEASRAMYNFAQALSSGSVKLMDWKSIELANMGTVEFKQQLMDAAVAAGTLAKQSDGMYKVLSKDAAGKEMDGVISATKNFNESLSNQWMTTKVLTSTLSKYADTTTDIGKRATIAATQVTTFSKLMDTLKESVGSGWAQTFEILLGDFNEARALWTGINATLGTTIAEMSDARNALLSGGLGSGWKQFMKEGITDTTAFGNTLTNVAKEAGVDLGALVKQTGSMEKALQGNWLTGGMLTKTIVKMSSSIENLSDKQLKNAGYTEKTKKELLKLRDALLSGTLSADDFAKKMSAMSGRENIIQGLKNSVVALLTAIRPISKAFDQIFPPTTVKTLYQMTENFKNLTEKMILSEATTNKIQRTFAGFFAILDIGWETVKFLGQAVFEVVDAFAPLNGGILETSASIGDFLIVLNQIIKRSQIFEYGLLGVKIAAFIIGQTISNATTIFSIFVRTLMSAEHPLQYLGQVMQDVFSDIFVTLNSGTRWITTKFFGALSTIQKFFTDKLNFGDGTMITEILNSIKEFMFYVTNGGADGVVTLGEALNGLDFSRIATFVTGGIILVFINQLTRLTKVSSDLVETTNGFVSKLSKKLFAPITKFKDLAFAVGVLSASLYVLSTIPFDRMKVGLAGLAGAMAIFTASYAMMQTITVIASKQLNGVEAMQSALSLTAMAGGLAILAVAITKISKIDRGTVWNSVAVVGAMMGIITAYQALTVAISRMPGTRAANIGMGLMASGLLGLVTLVLIMDHIKPETITESLGKLTVAMLMLAGIQSLFALAARSSGGAKVAVNVFGIATGILAMIGVIKLIGLLSQDEIVQGAKNVFLLGGILAAVQSMFSIASRINGGVKFRTNILAIQLGVASMIALSVIAGRMNQQELQNGIVNIAKMGAIIGALEVVTGLAARLGGGMKLQSILGSISLTLLTFTGIIAILGKFKQETIDRGFNALMKITGLIMGIQAVTTIIGNIRGSARGFSVLIGITATILTVTASLSLLSMIDQEALTQASMSLSRTVLAIGVMAAGVSLMIQTVGGLSSSFTMLKGVANVILPGFVILASLLGGTLLFLNTVSFNATMLKTIDFEAIKKFTIGIGIVSVLLGAITLLTKIPGLGSNMGSLKGLIPGFIGAGAVIVATAGFFWLLSTSLSSVNSINWSSLAKFTQGIDVVSGLMIKLALLSPLFMLFGAGFSLTMTGIGGAILGVGAVVLAFTGLAATMEVLFAGKSDFLISGIDKLILIAEGLGRFAGALVGGFSSELIAGFGNGLARFSDSVSKIKPESFNGIESLAKAMLLLTGASLIDGLARFVSLGQNPADAFGRQIKGLLVAFEEIEPTSVANFSNVMQILGPTMGHFSALVKAANDIPNIGGLAGIFAGENNIDGFAQGVVGMVQAFSPLSIDNINTTKMVLQSLSPAMVSFAVLTKAAKTIPNSGGLSGLIMGENDMDIFALQIKNMIAAFSDITIVSVMSASNILSALRPTMTNFGTFIATAKTIPNSGGLAGLLMGSNDFDDFAKQLKGMVKAFSTIDGTQLQSANNNMLVMTTMLLPGLERFVTLYNRLNSSGGLAQMFKGQSSFVVLAEEIKSFAKVLKGVDVSVVAPALVSLNQINESFKVVGVEVITSAVASLKNNKTLFQTEIVNILQASIKIVDSYKGVMSNSFTSMFDETLKNSRKYTGQFEDLGYNIVRGLQNGITNGQKYANNAATNMAASVESATRKRLQVNSPSKLFAEIGSWLPTSIGRGIDQNSKVAILASANMGGNVEEAVRGSLGVHSESKIFNDIGSWVPKSLSSGIDKTKQSLLNNAKKMGIDTGDLSVKGLISGMASKEGMVTEGLNSLLELLTTGKLPPAIADAANQMGASAGTNIGTGMADGIDKSKGKVNSAATSAVKDAFQIFKESIDKRKEYNLISVEEEIAAWEGFAKKYAAGTEIRLKADKELGRVRYEASTKWIDREKYYKRMSLEQELAAWEIVQGRYKIGTDYRIQADREIFRIKQEIWQAEYQHELDALDDAKYYGKLKLNDELDGLKKIQKMTKENTEERKKADREVFRVNKEIQDANLSYENRLKQVEKDRTDARKKASDEYYAHEKEINEQLQRDITSLKDAYNSAVESRTKTLYSSFGIFDKIETPEAVQGTELIKNLEDQAAAFAEWQGNISVLAKKGVDEGLIKELQEMGPKASPQIQALNKLTETELNKYVSLWQIKSDQAKTQAISELESMRISTEKEITNITSAANTKLSEYRTVWDTTLSQINTDTRTQLDTISKEWSESVGTMSTTGISLIKQYKLDWFNEVDSIVEKTKAQFINMKDFISNMKVVTPTLEIPIFSPSLKEKAAANSIGSNIISGITEGMRKNTPALGKAANTASHTLDSRLKDYWDINSPSKRTMETGKYIVMGLAAGLTKFTKLATYAAGGLGAKTVDAMGLSLSGVSDLLANGSDEVTITPVVDLSNVRAGVTEVNSMFGKMSNLDLSTSMGLLPSSILPIKASTESVEDSKSKSNTQNPTTIENKFEIGELNVREEADVKKIAKELYTMQQQYSRYQGGAL